MLAIARIRIRIRIHIHIHTRTTRYARPCDDASTCCRGRASIADRRSQAAHRNSSHDGSRCAGQRRGAPRCKRRCPPCFTL